MVSTYDTASNKLPVEGLSSRMKKDICSRMVQSKHNPTLWLWAQTRQPDKAMGQESESDISISDSPSLDVPG
jgi:hypothetical protein